nr:hypothetical protein BaRGS_002399 [Batillaria attramentaria]
MESNIVRGSAGERHVALQLDILREKEKVNLLANYKLDAQQDVSLLQLAAFFHVPKNLPKDDGSVAKLSKSVVVQMAEMCPQLIWSSHREGQFEGQTVLHTIVSKQDVEATKAILDLCAKKIQAELRRGEVSILEIICETGRIEKAFGLLNTYVVKGIIREKWSHYRLWFILWFIAHVILMVFFTTYAVYKARLIRYHELQQLNATEPPSASAAEEAFVFAGAILAIPVALLLLLWEVVRVLNRQPLNLWLIHHNGVYRSILVIFALSVLTDSIWYFAKMPVPDNNYFLILALLVGWWFMTFFLRPFRKFSFFTVMLQKVLVGDMFRFSTVILLELLAFSVAMHMTYLPTPGPLPEDFEHLGITLLTMFKLMLGLTEVEILNDAPHPWLADLLYVMFTLLTYLLMLNALIAMMSNTCSIVAENRNSQFELQRLSVVLMLESMVPFKMRHCCGEKEKVAKYDVDNRRHMQPEKRFFKMVARVCECVWT